MNSFDGVRDLAEYPFDGHYLTRPGGRLHYVDHGVGPAVLMVHGNPSWSYLWRRLIARLAPNFRCLAPDHLGMGLSSRPLPGQYGFRLKDRVDDLAALVDSDSLGIEGKIHLVVHDWGGPIGLGWAAAHPERLGAVVVMNTATRRPRGYRPPLRLAAFKLAGPLGAFLGVRHNLFARGTAFFGTARRLDPAVRQGFLAPYRAEGEREAIGRFVEDIPLNPGHPSAAFLDGIDQALDRLLTEHPLALVWGQRDFVFNLRVFQDWRGRFPGAPCLPLPAAGHYLLEDEPERAADFVESFLKKHSA